MNKSLLYSLFIVLLSTQTLFAKVSTKVVFIPEYGTIHVENSIPYFLDRGGNNEFYAFTPNEYIPIKIFPKLNEFSLYPYIEGWKWQNGSIVFKDYIDPKGTDFKLVKIDGFHEHKIIVKSPKDTKTIYVHPKNLSFITPAGDPVNNPVQKGVGQNEFVFQRSIVIGYKWSLVIDVKVDIFGSYIKRQERKLLENIYFKGDNLEESMPISWSTNNEESPYGKPKLERGGVISSSLQYGKMPSRNSSFGPKYITVVYIDENGNETEIGKQKVEYFFKHKQCDYTAAPNWFYYWKEGGVIPAMKDYDVTFEEMSHMVAYSKGKRIIIGSKAIDPSVQQFPALANYVFVNAYKPRVKYHYVSEPSTIIDALCYTIAHEKLHTIINKHSHGLTDDDEIEYLGDEAMGDNVADKFEVSEKRARSLGAGAWKGRVKSFPSLMGIVSSSGNRDTWNIAEKLGAHYEKIGDNEMRVRIHEVREGEKLVLTFRKDLNWSDYRGKPDYNARSNYGKTGEYSD